MKILPWIWRPASKSRDLTQHLRAKEEERGLAGGKRFRLRERNKRKPSRGVWLREKALIMVLQ